MAWAMLLMLVVLPRFSHAQFFDIDSNQRRVNIPFRIVRNMVIVQLNINHKGPFNFVLDTGVGVMVITDTTLIDSLGNIPRRNIKLFGLGGEECEAYVTPNLHITMPYLSSHNVAAAVLKKDHFDLSGYAGMPIHGLLGYDFFNSLAVKLNFTDSVMTVTHPEDAGKLMRNGVKVPITIENKEPYAVTTIKLPDGKQISAKMVVDIGAGHPISLESMLQQNGLPQNFIVANLGVGLTGPVSGFVSRVPEFDIGNKKLKDVLTSFPDMNYLRKQMHIVPRDGNIGLGILKRFTVVFDYTNNAMYLKATSRLKDPFEHDMSGMEYYFDGDNYDRLIVGRVEPGSASDEVGLQKNDEITAINFKPVDKMSIEDIDNLFRSKDGRSLLLYVSRGKEILRIILTLKRRV
ncbi:aspartyl protease [Mucilaginibacter yixingensis]|uniref:Aspartyl protease n=1 Tax=Mucilaginibacter yixingensis TaxID=1295612 RepID=A0A2T5JCS1_9SPHI|nr:aspartyl protease family protein [Mucilaginibacter yixingensis]PTQ99568.1 aspartyl protease [Mucilaginibacter yixingensis]